MIVVRTLADDYTDQKQLMLNSAKLKAQVMWNIKILLGLRGHYLKCFLSSE